MHTATRLSLFLAVGAGLLLAACGNTTSTSTSTGQSAATPTLIGTPSAPAAPSPTRAAATPTPAPAAADIWAKHLRIPSLGIDATVQESHLVPVSNAGGGGGGGGGASEGCVAAPAEGPPPRTVRALQAPSPTPEPTPTPEPVGQTLTVPDQGIATPKDRFEHLEHRSWIFGHSRWLGVPGLFFTLGELNLGDELFLDGIDRATGEPVAAARFVVTGIYLSDTATGSALVTGERIGARGIPLVILQTSVRESGANRPWILDRTTLLGKAENVVAGDLDDPCKYLLLFVVAEYRP